MNPVVMTCFFEAPYYDIYKHLLAVGYKNGEFFGLVSIYYDTIEANG